MTLWRAGRRGRERRKEWGRWERCGIEGRVRKCQWQLSGVFLKLQYISGNQAQYKLS